MKDRDWRHLPVTGQSGLKNQGTIATVMCRGFWDGTLCPPLCKATVSLNSLTRITDNVCGDQRSATIASSAMTYLIPVWQCLSLNLQLSVLAGLSTVIPQCSAFCVASGNPTPGPHVHLESTLWTQDSSQPHRTVLTTLTLWVLLETTMIPVDYSILSIQLQSPKATFKPWIWI